MRPASREPSSPSACSSSPISGGRGSKTVAEADQTYEIGHPLGPLPLRIAVAAAVTAYGAWKGHAWLVPIAMFIAVPGLWAFNWALLAAVPRLATYGREHA